jgi:hypothetical protein
MCYLCGLNPEIIARLSAALPVFRLITFHRCAGCQRTVCNKCSRIFSGVRQCKDCSGLPAWAGTSRREKTHAQK